MSDPIIDSNPMALITSAQTQGITTWSETKKKDFVNVFTNRSLTARYILEQTANHILTIAKNRHFISQKNDNNLKFKVAGNYTTQNGSYNNHVGDRLTSDLINIAQERAKLITDQLPSTLKAVEIIKPEIAKKIKARDALIEKGQSILDQLKIASKDTSLKDIDQNMTVGQLRDQIKNQMKLRTKLNDQLNEIGAEGIELDDEINKALYQGMPGLSEAVMTVVNEHLQRADALDTASRRISEKVMFGDSEAAIELLSHFENDEIQVNDKIKEQFALAMEKLTLTKPVKKLAKKK